ncbi:MAG: hypothetical protein KF757_12345 [Phycisphaeraceae bacterium]|nr:hypothetical protein [Phycisphaeraceae bacterium]MCW5762481.1 hypothetical protein [Phycisphaeraceae bacterium]
MIPAAGDPQHWIFLLFGAIMGIAIMAATWRLIIGPSLPDRVVALDLIGFLVVAIICVYAMVAQQPAAISVALIAALVLFLGTAAFAVYLDRKGQR